MQVLTCDGYGGTEMMLCALVERTDPAAVATTVVTLDEPGPVFARLTAAGAPVRPLGGRGTLRAVLGLGRALRAARPDVVCAYGLKGSLTARVLARVLCPGARTVTGVRGLYVTDTERLDTLRGRVAMAAERLTQRLVDAYDANSTGALDVLAEHGVGRERLHWIPNGLDPSAWPVPDRAGRSEPLTVACVGRFIGLKRQEDLVEAAAILRGRGVTARFVLGGDGPTLDAVRDLARARGVDDLVAFPGRLEREAVAPLLADADVACLPSLWEGMPGAVMEAMACGLPVVGTRVNGIADLVEHERTGLLVPSRDPAALADALERLLRDPALRHAYGAAGRRRIVEELSLDRMVAAKTALYRTLAGR